MSSLSRAHGRGLPVVHTRHGRLRVDSAALTRSESLRRLLAASGPPAPAPPPLCVPVAPGPGPCEAGPLRASGGGMEAGPLRGLCHGSPHARTGRAVLSPLPLSLLAITVCEKMCLCGACCWSARYLLAAQGTTRYLVGIRWSPAQSPSLPSSLPLPPPPSLARSLERERKRARGREGGREGSGPPLLKFHFFPGYERFKPRSWLLMPPTPR